MENEQILLSMETAVRGGSISLLKGSREIDFWLGTDKVSKAEDILEQISVLLVKNKVEKYQIDLIIVSNGPGSVTGIRIGNALAKGLEKSLNCPLINVSVLEAMQLKADLKDSENTIVTAVPVGSTQICHQIFGERGSKNNFFEPPIYSTLENFVREIKSLKNAVLVIQVNLYEELNKFTCSTKTDLPVRIETEFNLAKWVGLYGKENREEIII